MVQNVCLEGPAPPNKICHKLRLCLHLGEKTETCKSVSKSVSLGEHDMAVM